MKPEEFKESGNGRSKKMEIEGYRKSVSPINKNKPSTPKISNNFKNEQNIFATQQKSNQNNNSNNYRFSYNP